MAKVFKHVCPGFTYAVITGAGLLTFQVPCGTGIPRSSGHDAATRCKKCAAKQTLYERMISHHEKLNGVKSF